MMGCKGAEAKEEEEGDALDTQRGEERREDRREELMGAWPIPENGQGSNDDRSVWSRS